jgi:hypothetical protein
MSARTAAAVLLASVAGCAADPALRCDTYAASSDEGKFCAYHRSAVLRFVRMPADPAQRRVRLESIRKFHGAVRDTRREDVITQAVLSLDKELPDWVRLYQEEHFWAARDCGIPVDEDRARLILDGFAHAIAELDRELLVK